jgi:hypothetical protein
MAHTTRLQCRTCGSALPAGVDPEKQEGELCADCRQWFQATWAKCQRLEHRAALPMALVLAFILLNLADAAITIFALSVGAFEANPWQAWMVHHLGPWGAMGVKMAFAAGIVWLIWVYASPRQVMVLRVLTVGLAAVAAFNTAVIPLMAF